MDDHPPKTRAMFVGEPVVQAHVRVPDSVNRSEWLKRKSAGRRRRSVHGSRHAGGTSTDGRGNPATERNFSPPPGDRDVSVDSRASSIASSTSTTISRLSMVSAPPRPTQPRQARNGYEPAARRYVAVGDRGRRRVSFDEGPPQVATASAAAAAVASAETLSSSSTSSSTRCAVCQADFTRYRRPHRCRACGKTVCATCSPARMPKRTCKRCAGGSAAPPVVAAVSPLRQAMAAPRAPPKGLARATRRSVGSSARVMVAGAPSKPVSVVAEATHSVRACVDGPKQVGTGELKVLSRSDSSNASKEEVKASGSVDGVGDGERVGGVDLPGGVGREELEESTSLAGDGNGDAKGLDRPGKDRVETVGALDNASHVEEAGEAFPSSVLSNNSPNRMVRRSITVAEPDDSAPAVSAGADQHVPPFSCVASDNTEGLVVCGAEATVAEVDGAASSEGGGGGSGDRELEEAAGSCLPADPSVEPATSPITDGDSSHKDEVLERSVGEHSAPEVVPVIDGKRSREDEALQPAVSEHCAPEAVAEPEAAVAAAAASCAAATPPPSSPNPPERAEQQPATTNPEELVLEPYPMGPTEQPETAPSSETAEQPEGAAVQPEEERVAFPQQVLSQPIGQRLSFEDGGHAEEKEEEEEEAGLSVKGTDKRSADEEAAEDEKTSSPAVLGKHHKEEEAGGEHEYGVAQEDEDNSVEETVNKGQEGTGDLLAATSEFCAESSVDEGPLGAGRKATDMVVTDVPQDEPENEGQGDNASNEAVVEEKYDCQRKEQQVKRAPVAGLLLGNGGDEGFGAAKRGDAGSTAVQQGGEEKDVEVAATTVEGGHGEAGFGCSTAGRASDAESRASDAAAAPEEDQGLLVTSPTNEDAERRASSQDDQVGIREKEAGVAAAVTEVVTTLARPSDKGSGLVDSETEGRGPSSAVPVSPDEEESVRGQETDATENVGGGKGFCDQEGSVADKSVVTPALPRDDEVGGGGPQRAVEPPTAPSSCVPGGSIDDIDVEPSGGDCGEETSSMVVPPPPTPHSNPPTARIESPRGAGDGEVISPGVVLAEAGEGAGGFLAALKELLQKGGSCCR